MNSERRSEPRDINDILAEIMADLKARKEADAVNDPERNSNKEYQQ